jgi:thiol:disulfide interchange protein DsbD
VKRKFLPLFPALALLFALHAGAKESLKAEHVRVSWVAPKTFDLEAGATVGIRFVPDPGWHLYWKNPGDSGAPPRFRLRAEGARCGEVGWPYPVRMQYGTFVDFGYEGEVVFPLDVKPEGGGSARVEAKLEWAVCKEICIIGTGILALERPVRAEEKWKSAARARLSGFEARVPRPSDESPWEIAGARLFPERLVLTLKAKDGSRPPRAPDAFPVNGNLVLPQAPAVERADGGFRLTFDVPGGVAPFASTGFVLVEEGRAWEFPSVPVVAEGFPSASHNVE